MSPHLVALSEGPDIPLTKPIVLIGRHQECDIQIPSRKISRRHCCIAQVSKYLVVRDLGSTNGIRINGVRAHEGKLHAGDELTIGNMRYEVRWLENGGPPPAPIPPVEKIPDPPQAAHELIDSSEQPIPLPDASNDKPLRALPVPPEAQRPSHGDKKDSGALPFDPIKLIPLDSSKFP
jgi:predicted component of type VI protein secretion system